MTYQLTVTLPKETGRRIQKIAVERNVRPEKVIADLVDESMEREIEAFMAMKPYLIEHHLEQYTAVTGGELVDVDDDMIVLMKRVDRKYGDQTVLIRQVQKEPLPILNWRRVRFD